MIYASGMLVDDVVGRVGSEPRNRGHDRPWLMLNMVSSIDGAIEIGGSATPLSDDDDRELFRALRAVSDVILVGAGTVRDENYGPAPGLVIVSGSLDLHPEARVFSDPERRPTIVTLEGVAGADLDDVADVIRYPKLDGPTIMSDLSGVVLCEGGPTLNGHLLSARLVDEINWTVSPTIVSGESKRMVAGDEVIPPEEFSLARTWNGERCLFLRYVKLEKSLEVDLA